MGRKVVNGKFRVSQQCAYATVNGNYRLDSASKSIASVLREVIYLLVIVDKAAFQVVWSFLNLQVQNNTAKQ